MSYSLNADALEVSRRHTRLLLCMLWHVVTGGDPIISAKPRNVTNITSCLCFSSLSVIAKFTNSNTVLASASNGGAIEAGQKLTASGDACDEARIADPRELSDNLEMLEDDMMAEELEEGFQRLCGGEQTAEILRVCDKVAMAMKNMEVLIRVKVTKFMRCGHSNHEAVEQVGSVGTAAARKDWPTCGENVRRALCWSAGMCEENGLRGDRSAQQFEETLKKSGWLQKWMVDAKPATKAEGPIGIDGPTRSTRTKAQAACINGRQRRPRGIRRCTDNW
ncbi:unnamed protein product [Nippostrongylus brasiliensis]|uniref:SICAvar, type II n=1 Tax=Nippostrongylus brasiliensis TaxID=27835 RepID=A0A0N4XZA3_NIPBR|nr:unnamed protein product [Nippostrongylus brasiliensis]